VEEIRNVCRFELPAFDMYCRLELWSGIRCVNVLDKLFRFELAVAVRNAWLYPYDSLSTMPSARSDLVAVLP
jgi:hypothetical protein